MGHNIKFVLGAIASLTPGVTHAQLSGDAIQEPQNIAEEQKSDNAQHAQDVDIVVTARSRNEKLHDVPATISVISPDVLAKSGARVATDFAQMTAGLVIQTGNVQPGDTSINLRGLNSARDGENNVALVVDGVLRTNMVATTQPQGPITQVEILKGPQGAIYGRSAAAGAIVITTRKPGDHLEGELRGRIGDRNTYLAEGTLSGPITDQIGFTVQAQYARSDGGWRNRFLSSDLNQQVYPGNSKDSSSIDPYDQTYLFGRLLITPSNATEIDIKANYGHLKAGAINYNGVFQLPGFVTAFNDPIFNGNINDLHYVFSNDLPSRSWQRSYGASIRLVQDLDFAVMRGFVSYNNVTSDYYAGGTSGAFGFFANEPTCVATLAATLNAPKQEPFGRYPGFAFAQPYSPSTCDGTQYNRTTQKDVVSEIRLVAPEGNFLQWQLGTSYIFIDRRACYNLSLDTGHGESRQCFTTDPRFRTESLADDSYRTNVYAVFGSIEFEPLSRVKVGVALRYDIEARETSNNIPVGVRTLWVGNPTTGHPIGTPTTPADYYINPGLDPAYGGNGLFFSPKSRTFRQLQPKITLSYKVTDSATVFANWGIGFKAGGFNPAGTEAIINGYFNARLPADRQLSVGDFFKQEVDSAFEAGTKITLGRGASLEVAGFYTNAKNMQFWDFFVGDFGYIRSVSNIDRVRIFGVDASINYTITKGLSVFASGNVTDSKITRNVSRPYTVGNKSPTTPDYSLAFGLQADLPLTQSVNFNFRTDTKVTGPTPFHIVQHNTVPSVLGFGVADYSNSIRDTYAIVNVRAGISVDRWMLTAFATNLFDKVYADDIVVAPEFGGSFGAAGQRRKIGLELDYKF
ncbi:MAG: hypothetical protein JWR80_3315 [Bradyrhizobium sp.]|nr:hypothetical protein [Bradyrhizobium sp.]